VNYYYNALSYISEKQPTSLFNISCYREDCDYEYVNNIIELLADKFPSYNFHIMSNQGFEDWQQLLEMSLHPYNIIANSTFSWWGAYLNNNENKIVCYPEKWFHSKANKNTSDLFPDNWILISC
jgi:hypothetical protein